MLCCENGARSFAERAIKSTVAVLPGGVREEIVGLFVTRRDFPRGLTEVRLRTPGKCSVVVRGENIPLMASVTKREMTETLGRICKGAIYAYRDTLMDGYIPMDHGVRVGVAGTARYEGGKMVGVSEPSSMVFRLPTGACDFGDDLADEWVRRGRENMLIIAPPGGGKTTALRSLAYNIGSGRHAMRVVAVDERCELVADDYHSCLVDIIRGYSRASGIEMALRTMSAQLILVDEIASEADADALRVAAGAGVPVIATAHAGEPEDLRTRKYLSELVAGAGRVFDQIAVIRHTGSAFCCSIRRI